MSINLNFGLFWSGAPMSYLRYLTFKTLRFYHPNATIELWFATKYKKDGYKWVDEKQDFENNLKSNDYLSKMDELNVKVIETDKYSDYQPNFQSDIFRWDWLQNNSGFYLDTDQIILKSFSSLPLDNNLIYSAYPAKSCGFYSPVGVIGAYNSEMVDWINKLLPQFSNPNNYNSMGPFMFRTMLKMRQWKEKMFNAPSDYFYPIPDSYLVPNIFNGDLNKDIDSFAVHWFGGHPESQKFNAGYTEDFAMKSNDSISVILRDRKII